MTPKRPKPPALAALLAALLVMASILTACQGAVSAVPTVSGTDVPPVGSVTSEPTPTLALEPPPTLVPSSTPAPTLSPEEAKWVGRYDEVLSQYKDVMALDAQEGYYIEYEDLGSYVNENVIMGRFPGWTVYYALYDIDNNAIPELIIKGGPAEDMSQFDPAPYTYETQYDIFTYKDGDVVNIFQNHYKDVYLGNPSFGFHFNFTLHSNGIIAVHANVGSGFWIEEFYRLSSDGYPEFMAGVYRDSNFTEKKYTEYTDYTDNYYYAPEISEQEYSSILDRYMETSHDKNGVMLDWKPLSLE